MGIKCEIPPLQIAVCCVFGFISVNPYSIVRVVECWLGPGLGHSCRRTEYVFDFASTVLCLSLVTACCWPMRYPTAWRETKRPKRPPDAFVYLHQSEMYGEWCLLLLLVVIFTEKKMNTISCVCVSAKPQPETAGLKANSICNRDHRINFVCVSPSSISVSLSPSLRVLCFV